MSRPSENVILTKLYDESEKFFDQFSDNSDDITGWNGRRLHSADDSLSLVFKKSSKTQNFQVPSLKKKNFNIGKLQPKYVPESFKRTNFVFFESKKEGFNNKMKIIKTYPHKASPIRNKIKSPFFYPASKYCGLEDFLQKTKLRKRDCFSNASSPVKEKSRKMSLLMNIFD